MLTGFLFTPTFPPQTQIKSGVYTEAEQIALACFFVAQSETLRFLDVQLNLVSVTQDALL